MWYGTEGNKVKTTEVVLQGEKERWLLKIQAYIIYFLLKCPSVPENIEKVKINMLCAHLGLWLRHLLGTPNLTLECLGLSAFSASISKMWLKLNAHPRRPVMEYFVSLHSDESPNLVLDFLLQFCLAVAISDILGMNQGTACHYLSASQINSLLKMFEMSWVSFYFILLFIYLFLLLLYMHTISFGILYFHLVIFF